MKNLALRAVRSSTLALACAVVTFGGCASVADEPGTIEGKVVSNYDLPGLAWQNIVNASFSPGWVTTMGSPTVVLRPAAGNYVRVSWPSSCGATLTDIGFINFEGHAGANVVAFNDNGVTYSSYYHFNDDKSETVRFLWASVSSPFGCTLSFEQANGYAYSPPRPAPGDVTFADCKWAADSLNEASALYVWRHYGAYVGGPKDGKSCSVVMAFAKESDTNGWGRGGVRGTYPNGYDSLSGVPVPITFFIYDGSGPAIEPIQPGTGDGSGCNYNFLRPKCGERADRIYYCIDGKKVGLLCSVCVRNASADVADTCR